MTRTYTRHVRRSIDLETERVIIDEDVTLVDTGDGSYDVVFRAKTIGTVSQTKISTDRQAGRYRIPGKGRPGFSSDLAWAVKRAAFDAMRAHGQDTFHAFRGSQHNTMTEAAAYVVTMHVKAMDWIGRP